MVWQLPRQQSDKPDGRTNGHRQRMKKLKCQSWRKEEGGRRRINCGNGSAYKNNLASNKIGKIASNWIRKMRAVALLSIWYSMVPADLLKHLLRELWEVGGGGQLPAKHPQWVENIKRVFISTFFSTLQPFHALTQLKQILWECCEGRERNEEGGCE